MELLTTITIIGILAAIAIPIYQQYVQRARRTEAKTALLRIQGAQERYFTVNNKYETDPNKLQLKPCDANKTGSADECASSLYMIEITPDGGNIATGYSLTARINGQFSDDLCQSFTINTANVKTSTGSGTSQQCWGS